MDLVNSCRRRERKRVALISTVRKPAILEERKSGKLQSRPGLLMERRDPDPGSATKIHSDQSYVHVQVQGRMETFHQVTM